MKLSIEKIRSNRKTKDAEFVKKKTFALDPAPFRRNVSKKALKKEVMRESVKVHKFDDMKHVNIVNIPMFTIHKGNNLRKKEGIRKTKSLDKTEFGQEIEE